MIPIIQAEGFPQKGEDAMSSKKTSSELELKKKTLEAWAKILYREGKIDLSRCNRMIEAIAKLTA